MHKPLQNDDILVISSNFSNREMGAANTTSSKSESGKDLLCCTECSKIDPLKLARGISSDKRYKDWSESVESSRKAPRKSHRQIIPQEASHTLDQNESMDSRKFTYPPISAPAVTTALHPPSRRSSLSFAGNLPEDWTEEQQEQLQWAVTETARRSRLRPPGHKAMKAVLAARAKGQREAANAYGGRSLSTTHPILPAQDCRSRPLHSTPRTCFSSSHNPEVKNRLP